MDKQLINSLQKYKKPENNLLKSKDCIICLEALDIEAQKNVWLPCNCANSVYHIDCIVQFLKSGQNKNFCPHCRTVYVIDIEIRQIIPLLDNRIVPLEIVNQNNHVFEHNRKMVYIFIIHFFSNSLLNIINLSSIDDYPKKSIDILGKIIMINSLCKLFVNACFIISLKDNIEKIQTWLAYSYTVQSIQFILVICLVSLLKKNNSIILLLLNNVFFFICDLVFRLSIDYNIYTRIANIN
jgi:hypothetical protein